MRTPASFRLISAITLSMLAIHAASAQQRCKFSYEGGTEEASYPQQLRLDVGDTPGHIIGAYEVRRGPTPSAKPNCEGFKVVERLTHGFSDTIDRNGRVWGYGTITLDNGDKIYTEYSGSVSAVTDADGSLMSMTNAISTWTGGTGRYLGVRGVTRDKSENFYVKDSQGKLNAKTNKLSSEGEYWFEK
jgi:hypothetical protein